MLNEFRLTPLEKKNILLDSKSLVSQDLYEIRSYNSGTSGFNPGIEENPESSWSEFIEYPAVIQEIDEFKRNRYDYGASIEGDLILLLPYDTTLPKNAAKYEFKYNKAVFSTDTLQKHSLLDGTVTHYYLVGKR